MGTLFNTETIDFTGGMNTVLASHLINKSESRGLVNVNIKKGSLASMPTLKLITKADNRYFVQFKQELYYYNRFRSNAFLDNNMYWADGISSGKTLADGRELPLGIASPATPAVIEEVNTGAGKHKGDFKYCYTFYSTDTGVESAPSPLTPYLTVDRDDIRVSGLKTLPDEADRYRIYRIGGYLPRFALVAEIEDTDTPYTDELDDTEIDGRILQTLQSQAPIAGMNDFVELKGRLFGSKGAKVYFSALGNPDAWYVNNFFTMPDDITALAKSPAGLLVLGKNFTYLLAGTSPQNFQLKVVSNDLGCIARESVAYINGSAVWLGTKGIYTSNGYNITNLTADKIETIGNINPTSACTVNEVYYLSFKPFLTPKSGLYPKNGLYPAGVKGTSVTSEGIITMDFKRGNNYSYSLYDYGHIASLGVNNGEVNIITALSDVVFLSCTEPLACDGFLQCSQYDLNSIGEYRDTKYTKLVYISPRFIDGSFSTLKEYDKVRLNLWGDFNVKVMFSDGQIAVEENVVAKFNRNLIKSLDGITLGFDRDATTTIGIPNKANKSYSIGFIIEGVGIVKSIQYSWKPRELP